MSLSLEMSQDALLSIRSIDSIEARKAIKDIIEEIVQNPVARATGFSYSMKCCDGFLHAGGMTYSYEIDFEHDENVLTIHRLSVELPGPH